MDKSRQLGQIRPQQPPQRTLVIPHQISNLNRLLSPPSTLLIRRNEVEIYRTIERHCGEPFEFFVWIVVALGFAVFVHIIVSVGVVIVAAG